MLMSREDYLFSQGDSFAVVQHKKATVENEIAGIEPNRLLNSNVDDLVNYIVEKLRVDIPVLDEDNMSVEQHEATRDVSGDPSRMAYHLGNRAPVNVVGTEVIVAIPFLGDAALFKIQPSTYSTMPPRGEVRED